METPAVAFPQRSVALQSVWIVEFLRIFVAYYGFKSRWVDTLDIVQDARACAIRVPYALDFHVRLVRYDVEKRGKTIRWRRGGGSLSCNATRHQ
jgi:hypothetical protein